MFRIVLSKGMPGLDTGAMIVAKPKSERSPGLLHLIALSGLLVGALLLAGCSSFTSPVSGSHAGVTIKGHDVTEVVLMTREVFADHGYALAGAETDRMIFERPGTKGEQVKYGSFGSTSVVMRAKVDIQEMGPDTFYLRCDLFSVRDAGQSMLEDETRMVLVNSKSYQSIMDEVSARLEGPVDE